MNPSPGRRVATCCDDPPAGQGPSIERPEGAIGLLAPGFLSIRERFPHVATLWMSCGLMIPSPKVPCQVRLAGDGATTATPAAGGIRCTSAFPEAGTWVVAADARRTERIGLELRRTDRARRTERCAAEYPSVGRCPRHSGCRPLPEHGGLVRRGRFAFGPWHAQGRVVRRLAVERGPLHKVCRGAFRKVLPAPSEHVDKLAPNVRRGWQVGVVLVAVAVDQCLYVVVSAREPDDSGVYTRS